MSVAALPLDPGAQARVLLHHPLDSGDIIGRDEAGRAVIQLAADDWLLEQLLTLMRVQRTSRNPTTPRRTMMPSRIVQPSCASTGRLLGGSIAIGNTLAGRTLPDFAASAAAWISLTDSDHR
jgi:hypothetical protein